MAQKKITDLVELTSFAVGDLLPIEDISAGETKKIQASNLLTALYKNGTKTAESFISVGDNQGGIKLLSDTGASTGFVMMDDDGGEMHVYNSTSGGAISLTGRNISAAYKVLLSCDPDGATTLYYAGTKKLETMTHGIEVGDGTNELRLSHDGWAKMISLVNGAPIIFSGLNASGVEKTLMWVDPDGATELYNAGIRTLKTGASTVTILSTDGTSPGVVQLGDGSTNGSWRFLASGDNLLIQQRESGEAVLAI